MTQMKFKTSSRNLCSKGSLIAAVCDYGLPGHGPRRLSIYSDPESGYQAIRLGLWLFYASLFLFFDRTRPFGATKELNSDGN